MFNHHAVLLVGNSLASALPDLSLADTEIEMYKFSALPIAEVRRIIERAYIKPQSLPTKTIVLEVGSIAHESQNALLKVLEEPPASTKFIFVIPSLSGLLPTVLSRFMVMESAGVSEPHDDLFANFLGSSYADRINLITKITKDKEIDKIEMLRSGVYNWIAKNQTYNKTADILWCANTIGDRGASKKMLLEQIALLLPL